MKPRVPEESVLRYTASVFSSGKTQLTYGLHSSHLPYQIPETYKLIGHSCTLTTKRYIQQLENADMLSFVSRIHLRRYSLSSRHLQLQQQQQLSTDRLLIVGSGVAGCSAALIAAERHQIPVTILCAGAKATDCNSNWAQGGIIYRNYHPNSGDSVASLAADIHRAGAGLCVDEAVQKVAKEGPKRVKELLLSQEGIFANVPFQKKEDGEWALCLGTLT